MKATNGEGATARGANPRRALAAVRRVTDERAYLYQIIQTIGSGPDLEAILRGIVRLVTEATSCHACFVYFTTDDSLTLRAATSTYAHLEGKVTIPLGEGLTGWVAKTRRSAFIQENALEDPRVRRAYFPEMGDDVYESLVSVPIFARSGDVIGAITLHAEAPHEFARADLDFLEHTASLIAGAVENARLYEEATARVEMLTRLSRLSQDVASAGSLDELLGAVTEGCRKLLPAQRAEIYLLDAVDRLSLRAASPERGRGPSLDTRRLWVDFLERGRGRPGVEDAKRLASILWGERVDGNPLFVPLVVGDEYLGILALVCLAPPSEVEDLATAVASHTAVAIKQHQLIDRLKEKNLVKDFFEALAAGTLGDDLSSQAGRLSCDPDAPHLVLHMVAWDVPIPAVRPGRRARSEKAPAPLPWREVAARIESRLQAELPGTLFDDRERSIRALLDASHVPAEEIAQLLRRIYRDATGGQPQALAVGISDACAGAASYRQGFEEAVQAAEIGSLIRGGPGVTTYEDLGPYKYVLLTEEGVRDRYQQPLERLADYDLRRNTRLLETLEAYLDRRGNVVATSRTLYIHANTLRQRLSRIERVAGLDLEQEDWLSLAIATKLVKLRLMRRSAGGSVEGALKGSGKKAPEERSVSDG